MAWPHRREQESVPGPQLSLAWNTHSQPSLSLTPTSLLPPPGLPEPPGPCGPLQSPDTFPVRWPTPRRWRSLVSLQPLPKNCAAWLIESMA